MKPLACLLIGLLLGLLVGALLVLALAGRSAPARSGYDGLILPAHDD